VLGFGTMRLPMARTDPDFEPSIRLIRHAVKRGITLFDVGTFYGHGHCETAFGLATRDLPSGRILICGKNAAHQTRDPDWRGQLDRSLSRFYRDRFDLYFLHNLHLEDWRTYFLEGRVIDQIKAARTGGRFRHLGFSSHDTPDNVRRLIDTGWFSAVILSYNLLRQDYEGVMRYAHEKGLGVIVMNPLAGGALADPHLYLRESGGEKGAAADTALNFVLSRPFVHAVLSGMASKEIIDANVDTVDGPRLDGATMDRLKRRISQRKAEALIPCTACGYCMPCTQGIDIPAVLEIRNRYALLGEGRVFDRDYALLPVPADCCIRCGGCSDNCTQGIDIPAAMEGAARLLGDPVTGGRPRSGE
jgi:hypothetical protein